MASLQGRHALVTGGGRGIGRAIAAALTQAGAAVTIAGRNEKPLAEAVGQGAAAGYVIADVTDAQAVAKGVRDAVGARGAVDLLIANAGGAESAPFSRTTPDQFRRLFELNVMGVVHATRAVLDGMRERRAGRIVAIASTAGLKGYGYVSAYCAAKHALVGFVRSLAVETAASGVTVNAVCPGYTDTDLVQESLAKISAKTGRSRDDALGSLLKDSPLGRLVKPQEVAAAVLYLCSPEASAVTGTTLVVAGGELMDDRTVIPLDAETKVSERPDDHKTELRLWLRLLTCTTLIENEVRRRLRDQFDITLPRFDLLAQLDRAPNGMTLGELSQRMMVSNGNITALVERLAEQGLIRRKPLPNDRRVQIVSLTAEGQKFFRSMAQVNADWVGEIFAGLTPRDIEALMPLLAKTKQSARKALKKEDAT